MQQLPDAHHYRQIELFHDIIIIIIIVMFKY